MEIGKKLSDALNKQMNEELASGYIYLGMAAYFDSENLKGFSHWFKKQAEEEQKHSMKFYKHIIDRGGKVILKDVLAPKASWKSPLEAVLAAYAHEQKITAMISALSELAHAEGDKAAEVFLHWFVSEQVEEEANASELVAKVKQHGSGGGLLVLDHHLGKRE